MEDAARYLYERIGKWILPADDLTGWMTRNVVMNAAGKRVSLRGPGKVAILATDESCWVMTKFLPPQGLPPHVAWGAKEVVGDLVEKAAGLNVRWFGVVLSNVSPADHLSRLYPNMPDSIVKSFHTESGRGAITWNVDLAAHVAGLLLESGMKIKDYGKAAIGILDDFSRGVMPRAMKTLDEQRIGKKIYNAFLREMPEVICDRNLRRGIRCAINSMAANEEERDA